MNDPPLITSRLAPTSNSWTATYRFISRDAAPQLLEFEELRNRSYAVAAYLINDLKVTPGDRVILCYPPGVSFFPAFFGCLLAGTPCVPVAPPQPSNLEEDLQRLSRIVQDCSARVIFTDEQYLRFISLNKCWYFLKRQSRVFHGLPAFVSTSHLRRTSVIFDHAQLDDLAYIQYTSGSTGHPKGVRITNRMLSHNLQMINDQWPPPSYSHKPRNSVAWVPLFHDMGLVSSLYPVFYGNFVYTLISPTEFLRDPLFWIDAMSETQSYMSTTPNFAFGLVAKRVRALSPSERASKKWDLRCWKYALNASEQVRLDTMDSFWSEMHEFGFDKASFSAAYGMAESVLLVCAANDPTSLGVDSESLEKEGRYSPGDRILVGLGWPKHGDIQIFRGETCLAEGLVGEIGISSECVTPGYFTSPICTQSVNGKVYLLSGDLGFCLTHDGTKNLYFTGRSKDLIVIGGRNIACNDVETSIDRFAEAFPHIRQGNSATFGFSLTNNDTDVLGALIEVNEARDLEDVGLKLMDYIQTQHSLGVHTLVFLPKYGIPRTSSGKLKRQAAKALFLAGQLEGLMTYVRGEGFFSEARDARLSAEELRALITGNFSYPRFEEAMLSFLKDSLVLREGDTHETPFSSRIDSTQILQSTSQLEVIFGKLSPSILFDHPSTRSLCLALIKRNSLDCRFTSIDNEDSQTKVSYYLGTSLKELLLISLIIMVLLACTRWIQLRRGFDILDQSQPEFQIPSVIPGFFGRQQQFLPAFQAFLSSCIPMVSSTLLYAGSPRRNRWIPGILLVIFSFRWLGVLMIGLGALPHVVPRIPGSLAHKKGLWYFLMLGSPLLFGRDSLPSTYQLFPLISVRYFSLRLCSCGLDLLDLPKKASLTSTYEYLFYPPSVFLGPLFSYTQFDQRKTLNPKGNPKDLLFFVVLLGFGLFIQSSLMTWWFPTIIFQSHRQRIGVPEHFFYSLMNLLMNGSASFLRWQFPFLLISVMDPGFACPLDVRDSVFRASQNFRAFWRLYHASFAEFLQRYVYFPLGGGWRGLTATVLASGCVHGLDETWRVWSIFTLLALSVETYWGDRIHPVVNQVAVWLSLAVFLNFLDLRGLATFGLASFGVISVYRSIEIPR